MLVQQQAPTRWNSTNQQENNHQGPPFSLPVILKFLNYSIYIGMDNDSSFKYCLKTHVIRDIGIGYLSQDYSIPIVTYLSPNTVRQANHQPKKKTTLQANHQPKKKTNPKRNCFKEKKSSVSQTHHQHHQHHLPDNLPLQLCPE